MLSFPDTIREKLLELGAFLRETTVDLVSHLITTSADRRSQSRMNRARTGVEMEFEGLHNGINNPSQSAPPAGVDRRDDFAFRIEKEDGDTVRRLHDQPNAGLTGQDGVTSRTPFGGKSYDLHMDPVNLVHGNYVVQTDPVRQFSPIRVESFAQAERLFTAVIKPTAAKRKAMGHLHGLERTTNQ
jgi:hypothetical protein